MREDKINNPKIIFHLYLLLGIILIALLVWYTIDIFLLAFAGILLAIAIRAFGKLIHTYTGLSINFSVSLGLIALILLLTIIGFIIYPAIGKQISQLFIDLPAAWDKLSNDFLSFLNGTTNTSSSSNANLSKIIGKTQNIPGKLGIIFSSTFGFFMNLLIILFFGISLAYQPDIYKGFVALFPKQKQGKVLKIINDINQNLKLWLAGKAASMVIIGLLTWGGLFLLNIPLAFTLGMIAAILSFIPNIGPIIAAAPAILLAILKSPIFAVYVIILYSLIQTLESYLITPIIQQKVISLHAALIVFTQLIMGLIAGILGLALATPLLVAIKILVQEIYLTKD